MAALCWTRTLVLKQLVTTTGPVLMDTEVVGSLLGLCSTGMSNKVLQLWRQRGLLVDYGRGAEPDNSDPFPEVNIGPQFDGLDGPLLKSLMTNKKAPCEECVMVLNKKWLCVDWQAGRRCFVCPRWGILHKPSFKKTTADLQWRILHGAIPWNAFISVVNPAVNLLARDIFLFVCFLFYRDILSNKIYLWYTGYDKRNPKRCTTPELTSEAKMAIYVSRKNKIEDKAA